VSDDPAPIEPSMKVATLLQDYPELEETLIEIAPPFRKLRNPLLRRSVAKVTSLRQAAAVAQIDLSDLVQQLRAAAGQPELPAAIASDRAAEPAPAPSWFLGSRIVAQVDAIENSEEISVLRVLEEARKLKSGEMVELRTDFLPAPLIDLIDGKGFRVWWRSESRDEFRTYVAPPG
jgi:hypothetical protein